MRNKRSKRLRKRGIRSGAALVALQNLDTGEIRLIIEHQRLHRELRDVMKYEVGNYKVHSDGMYKRLTVAYPEILDVRTMEHPINVALRMAEIDVKKPYSECRGPHSIDFYQRIDK